MPLIILGAVILFAAAYLVYTSRSKEENEKMDSFLGKLKGAIAPQPGGEAKEATTEKYEKSDDGKVVYAFKRGEEAVGAETGAGSDAGSASPEATELKDQAPGSEGDKEA